jgi:lysophospholipase L1-like esterase
MAISDIINRIKTAVYGKEVRENIANGIETVYNRQDEAIEIANQAKAKVEANDNRIDNLVNAPEGKDLEIQDLKFDEVNNIQYASAGERVNKINEQLNEKAKQSDLSETNTNVANIGNQINNIIAHNGDGVKDTELIQARGNGVVLNDRLMPMDANGVFYDGAEENGNATYVLNTSNLKGWGAIVSTTLSQITQIVLKRNTQYSLNYGSITNITVRLIELNSSSSLSGGTVIQEFSVPIATWTALANNQDLVLALTTPYTVVAGKYYAVTVFSTVGVDIAHVNETGGTNSQYVKGYMCQENTNTTYTATTNKSGLYFRLNQSTNPTKLIKIKGKQIKEHDDAIKSLQTQQTSNTNDIALIKKVGTYDKNSEENGSGGYINSLAVGTAKGWGAIVQTALTQIVQIAVKRSSTTIKSSYTSTSVTVNLYETDSATSISSARLIQSFSIPIAEWLALTNGQEKILVLTTPYTTITGKYYAVTVFANETVDVQQVGTYSGGGITIPTTENYKYGIWTSSSDAANSYVSTSGGAYGVYCKLYSALQSDIYVKFKGEQIKEHNEAIKTLQNDVTVLKGTKSKPYKNVYHNDFTSTSDFSVENWTIDTINKKAQPTALGGYVNNVLTNYLKLNKLYEADKRIARFITTLYSDTVLNVHFMRTITTGAVPNESMYSIDVPNKLLKMFSNVNRYITNTVVASKVVPFNIVSGNKYIIEVEKDDYTFYIRIIDFKTGEKCELSLQGWSGGTQIQYYALTWGAGVTPPIVHELNVAIMNEPLVCFVGDSITEGLGMSNLSGDDSLANRFAEMLRNKIGNCLISAGSSDTIDTVIAKFDSEFSKIKPKILFVTIGTNGTNASNALEKYQQIKSLCDNNGIELILNHIPCASNVATYDYITRNNTIDQVGVLGCKFDVATAINNEVSQGYNASFFGDGIHPNYTGSIAMYNRVKIDCNFNI